MGIELALVGRQIEQLRDASLDQRSLSRHLCSAKLSIITACPDCSRGPKARAK